VTGVAFSPDGLRLATASRDETARLWDARTGQELLTLKGHTAQVRSVSFSPDGTRLATTSADGTARLWDARTGQELRALKGHAGWVWCVAFSPDGTRLATASDDKTARLWDSQFGNDVARYLWATRHDPSWHAEQAKALGPNAPPFAVAFHR